MISDYQLANFFLSQVAVAFKQNNKADPGRTAKASQPTFRRVGRCQIKTNLLQGEVTTDEVLLFAANSKTKSWLVI